ANLGGSAFVQQAKSIVMAMRASKVKRIIIISSLGIYDEVPGNFGEWSNNTLGELLVSDRKATDVIEASDLDYTSLRPAWLTNKDEVDYEITQKDEPFKGTEVSHKSVAELVVKLTKPPELGIRSSLGVNKPNTDGDKPAFL